MTRHKVDWLQWLNAQGAHLPMADPRPVRPRLLAAVRSRDNDGWQMDVQGKSWENHRKMVGKIYGKMMGKICEKCMGKYVPKSEKCGPNNDQT